MEINAKTLLSEYKKSKARLLIIRAVLDSTPYAVISSDGKIEEMATSRRALDGMPVSRNFGSPTEHAALHYENEARRERSQYRMDLKPLEEEQRKLEQLIALHDAALKVLNSAEVQLVRLHYDESLPFSQILEDSAFTGRIHSVSSLRRMHRAVLSKVDGVLRPSMALQMSQGG